MTTREDEQRAALRQVHEWAARSAEVLSEAGVPLWGLPARGFRGLKTWATAWPLTGHGLTGLGVTPTGELVRLPRSAAAYDYTEKVLAWVADNGYGGILQGVVPLQPGDVDVDGSNPPGTALVRVAGDGRIRVVATAMALEDALLEATAQLVREQRP